MKIKKQISHWGNFIDDILWLFRIVWKKHFIILSALLVVSVGIASVTLFQAYANSVLVNTIVDSLNGVVDRKVVIISLILVGASLVIPSFLYLFQRYFERQVYFFLSKYFDIVLEEKRLHLDISQYENSEFNNFVNRVNEKGIYVIGNIITNLFYDFQSFVTVIFSSIIIAKQSVEIFLIILVSAIPTFIISAKYGKSGWYIWGDEANSEERRKYWSIKGYIKSLSSLTEIKLFNLGKVLVNKILVFVEKIEKIQKKNEKDNLFRQIFVSIFTQGILFGAVLYFVNQAILGQISVGSVIFLFGAMVGFQNSISALFSSIGRQEEDRLYLNDLTKFLKIKPEMSDGKHELELTTSPEIVFDNITFAYPNSDKRIYESFSLKIGRGEKLAIVGLNGAGKTTLIKLLCRFYDPKIGSVSVDGKDLRSIRKNSWYQHIGVLFQDFAKFNFTTIGELVSFGDAKKVYSKQEVADSVDKSDAQFVKELKNSYDQQLGKEFKDGVEPSGGQWQKLAIARLFYRNPKIWILDEPTSAIDADAESKIFESLAKLPKDKTVILISHRFSTVRTADRIVVIDEGKVRESGTHEELMSLNGEYARLFNLQAEGYK
jgi:ABC-type multidrug transport system fused ATPase/permease subunit